MPPHTHHFRTGFSSQQNPVIKCKLKSTRQVSLKNRHFYPSDDNRSWIFTDTRCSLCNHITRRVCGTGYWCSFLLFSQGVRSSGSMTVPFTARGSWSQSCWPETCSYFCLTQRLLAHIPWSLLTQTGITSIFFIPVSNLDGLGIFILGSNHISALQLPPSFPTGNLKCLHFQMNNIQAIAAGEVRALQNTSHVTLILKGNDITHTEPGSFQSHFHSWGLVGSADIPGGDTELHSPGSSADKFQCLTRLQKLGLTQTHIHALPWHQCLSLLEEMVLKTNCFEYLCSTSSAAFPSLTCLHIKGNSKVLQPCSGCLGKLAKLQHLDLSHTECIDCSSTALRGWSRFCYLNLSHNTHLHLQDMLIYSSASLELLDYLSLLSISTLHRALSKICMSSKCWIFPHPTLILAFSISFKAWKTSCSWTLVKITELEIVPKDKLFQQIPNVEVLILPSCKR